MSRDVDYSANQNWLYSGDMNAYHGGIWIRHCGDYCDAIEVTDLDSACGFTGAVLIERKSTSLPRKLSEAKSKIKQAFAGYGWTMANLRGNSPAIRRALTWEALLQHGFGDSDTLETLQLETDGPMAFDGWKADRRQTGGDVGGYVMAKYLD